MSATAGTSHLLAREVDETTSIRVGPTYVDALLALDTLAEFRHSLGVVAATDIGIHVDGHAGVGGDVRAFPCTMIPSYLLILCQMVNVATSPNDPLFWMHHGFVDYVRLVRFLSRVLCGLMFEWCICCSFGGSGRVTTRLVSMI